jgi:hypothetical protein
MFGASQNTVSESPHLDTLTMGSSTYGQKVRIVYGTNRLPGNLVWVGTPTEHRHTTTQNSGGKGGGGGSSQTSITYTYSCSMAYMVCAGPVQGIRKIWAGGQLIYDASGDAITGTNTDSISFLLGSETQVASPVMQAQTAALTPAHRGQVLVIFNDYDLSEKFSNRFPTLQVEVCQTATITGTRIDPLPVELSAIITDMCTRSGISSGAVDVSAVTQSVYGWNVEDDFLSAMQKIGKAFGIGARDDAGTLVFYETDLLSIAGTIVSTDMGAGSTGAAAGDTSLLPMRMPDEYSLPAKMTVQYQDIARDGLSNAQTVMRTTVNSKNETSETYDFLMDATMARKIADRLLYRTWIEGTSFGAIKLGPQYLGLRPGHVVQATDDLGNLHTLRLTTVSIGSDYSVQASGVAYEGSNAVSYVVGEAGRFTPTPSVGLGATVARLLNLPPLAAANANTFGFYAAAIGASSAWRSALLYESPDGGVSWNTLATLPVYTVMGECSTILAAPPDKIGACNFDNVSTVVVTVIKGQLTSVTDEMLLGGANRAMVGGEIIQYGTATLVSAGTYTLSHLLRGVKSTEDAMASHVAWEAFTLLDTVTFVELPIASIGSTRKYKVVPIGGDITTEPEIAFVCTGEILRPWAPMRIRGTRNDPWLDLTLTWWRRSRLGSALPNRADIPLDCAPETYLVEIMSGDGLTVMRSMVVAGRTVTYSEAQQIADFGYTLTAANVRISQISALYGSGRTSTATI